MAVIESREAEFAEATNNALTRMRDRAQRGRFQQFIRDMGPFADQAKGQLFQDLWAWWESGLKRGGYFVEFGAASGVKLSNTYLLEKSAGWDGILAEPHPKFQASLAANRSCFMTDKCVYSVTGQRLKFLAVRYGELSRLADVSPDDEHEKQGKRSAGSEVEVETISLDDLLETAKAPKLIDYMSVDTEGSEYEILSAFDFERWKVRLLTVEHNRTSAREKLYKLLTDNSYRRQWEEFSRFDDWYVLDEPNK